MEVWPVQHAKARFSELLDACQQEGPKVVSHRGIETAVLVPIEEWRRVQAPWRRTRLTPSRRQRQSAARLGEPGRHPGRH